MTTQAHGKIIIIIMIIIIRHSYLPYLMGHLIVKLIDKTFFRANASYLAIWVVREEENIV